MSAHVFAVHRRVDDDGSVELADGSDPSELDCPRRLPVLTVSSTKAYRRCPREYYLGNVKLLRPRRERAQALRYGSAVHLGLETYLSTGDIQAAIATLTTADLDPFDAVRAEVMLIGYDARWADSGLETIAVEAEFDCPMTNPATGAASRTYRLAGKIDAVVRLPDGRVAIMEHKTTSVDISGGSPYWERLRLDAQVSTYFVGARSLGFDPEVCIYDVLRKPGIRPRLATPMESRRYKKDGSLYANQRTEDESPEQFRDRLIEAVSAAPDAHFARGEVVRFESEEKDAAHDMWMVGRMIRNSELAGRWPRNPDACERYGRFCEFWPLCVGQASEDEYDVGEAHEELSGEVVAA